MEVEVGSEGDEHAGDAADEVGEAEDEFGAVAGGENATGKLRGPVKREERTENFVLGLRVPVEAVAVVVVL